VYTGILITANLFIYSVFYVLVEVIHPKLGR